MKEINFTANNYSKIEAVITEAQGKSKERTLTVEDIANAFESIESHLSIPKTAMVGIVAVVDVNAQKFAKSYKYTPYSTIFTAVRKANCWAITNVKRDRCNAPGKRYCLTLTDKAKTAIIESMETFA